MAARIGITLALVIGLIYLCAFRVYEYEHAILFQLGKIQRFDYEPGLHFKMPFLQNVKTFDKRLQTLDAEPQRYLTGEKKDLIVDSFVRWKIADVVQFFNFFYTRRSTTVCAANSVSAQCGKSSLESAARSWISSPARPMSAARTWGWQSSTCA